MHFQERVKPQGTLTAAMEVTVLDFPQPVLATRTVLTLETAVMISTAFAVSLSAYVVYYSVGSLVKDPPRNWVGEIYRTLLSLHVR